MKNQGRVREELDLQVIAHEFRAYETTNFQSLAPLAKKLVGAPWGSTEYC